MAQDQNKQGVSLFDISLTPHTNIYIDVSKH